MKIDVCAITSFIYQVFRRIYMAYLILVRHGQSLWNLANKFTGWVDVPLSEKGLAEARSAANRLKDIDIDVAFTSTLIRAQQTLFTILAKHEKTGVFLHSQKKEKEWSLHPREFDKTEIPIYSSNKINERYYGDLQGKNKDSARKKFGENKVHIWRRSYDIPPPNGESLKDTCKRAIPYFEKEILPYVKKKKNVIIAAHGNSLRGIIKHIENISDEEIPKLELPTGKPIIYDYKNGKLTRIGKLA